MQTFEDQQWGDTCYNTFGFSQCICVNQDHFHRRVTLCRTRRNLIVKGFCLLCQHLAATGYKKWYSLKFNICFMCEHYFFIDSARMYTHVCERSHGIWLARTSSGKACICYHHKSTHLFDWLKDCSILRICWDLTLSPPHHPNQVNLTSFSLHFLTLLVPIEKSKSWVPHWPIWHALWVG